MKRLILACLLHSITLLGQEKELNVKIIINNPTLRNFDHYSLTQNLPIDTNLRISTNPQFSFGFGVSYGLKRNPFSVALGLDAFNTNLDYSYYTYYDDQGREIPVSSTSQKKNVFELNLVLSAKYIPFKDTTFELYIGSDITYHLLNFADKDKQSRFNPTSTTSNRINTSDRFAIAITGGGVLYRKLTFGGRLFPKKAKYKEKSGDKISFTSSLFQVEFGYKFSGI